ncbi:MAG: cytochrome-c oxidase, cbb3-type subunit III [Methylotenera sp. 24-45-7]|jgi:cytochrome c oxidase cbb3-type subunit 3|nr:MAG: cytochrome-c oxidase, cbb3-type subunit III [Mehylophilales bacterium 35-46-6]OYZ40924.1 MAG: cytochrome-c oxidase, cbb3-type subunit III [Methylotenera sp. 24-45-7]OZA54120.1 MAG: cytochrome-c oxidase, cbb3-type subunit III [Methylophilales bacterium 39-45-7]HQS36863.1 cytochrome-c oxidase, cbb3-type subunit III [Methylotenera sp.]HQS44301.1 cytochrome-c oxidase, cbb3-type subunit III [Methylotenera sp.]
MSDFTSSFWPIFITVISVGGVIGCALLLWLTSKIKATSPNGDNTNGHVWDENLREMNNPLPRWWVWMFIITIIFSLFYFAAYPAIGTYAGKLGWTQIKQYEQEMAVANKTIAPLYAKFAAMPVEELATNPEAQAIGERMFMNNCAQCHGSDAHGSRGFPNLTDSDWIHGGSPEKIVETLSNGRVGMMPPMAAAVGNEDDVKNVANYVLSLSNSTHDATRAAAGKEKFAICAACHGADGTGNQAIGAPNLADNIWLHGAGEEAIIKRINEGKVNQMPAQSTKFTPEQIHVLAAYVWGLSNNAAK